MAAKKAVVKKAAGGAVAKWDDELAKYATKEVARERAPVGQKMSIRGGVLQIGGNPIKENKAKVIILDSIYVNARYTGAFDPDSPTAPICWAMGREEGELAPDDKVHEAQNETCKGCPMNEFGSAHTGRGKGCKNGRRIAVIPVAGLTADNIEDMEPFFLDIPVTSVKGWSYYVHGLAKSLKRPVWSVVTEIAVVPDPKSQFRVMFDLDDPVTDSAMLNALKKLNAEAEQSIAFPFPAYQEPQEKSRGNKMAAGGKAGGNKLKVKARK